MRNGAEARQAKRDKSYFLKELNKNIVLAHNERMEHMKTIVADKKSQFSEAHEAELNRMALGIDWEIQEIEAQLAEDQHYLDELKAIKQEGIDDAQEQYKSFLAQFDQDVKEEFERQKEETDAIRYSLDNLPERRGRGNIDPSIEYKTVLDNYNYDYL